MLVKYICENCGNELTYDIEKQLLCCNACGNEKEIENAKIITDGEIISENNGLYICKSCGAEIVTDLETASTTCPFCDSAIQVAEKVEGIFKPDKIIPFKIKKTDAIELFSKYCKKCFLFPKGLKSADRIKEIKQIYIPFWLYDINSTGYYEGENTKVKRWSSGNYNYTETSYYRVIRKINCIFNKIPADASKKMHDETMDALEPFDYDELLDFNDAFLQGYNSEKYSYESNEIYERAKNKSKKYTKNLIYQTMSEYSTKTPKIETYKDKAEGLTYVLLPIYILIYNYEDKEYLFAINGQTGKVVGNPPFDKKKEWIVHILTTILMTIGFILFSLITERY